MKKIISIILALLIFGINYTNANVDQTNAFKSKYECSNGEGKLTIYFDLGGHHIYERYYKINKPGIIEVLDSKHTTIGKNLNLSIPGCDFKPDICEALPDKISEWKKVSERIIGNVEIIGKTQILKNGNNVKVINKNDEKNIILKIKNFDKESMFEFNHDFSLILDNLNGVKILTGEEEKNIISFPNRLKSLKNGDDFINNDLIFEVKNNFIIVKENYYKREVSGVGKSSKNDLDIFKSYDGKNFGVGSFISDNTDPKKVVNNNGYATQLGYWNYMQHNYTTTDVKLYSVPVTCNYTEDSFGLKNITGGDYFDSTINGFEEPEFDVSSLKINDTNITDKNFSNEIFSPIIIFADDKINISGLKYKKTGKRVSNGKAEIIPVTGVKVSLKRKIGRDIITLSEKNIKFKQEYRKAGLLENITDLELINSKSGKIVTTEAFENYVLVFSFMFGDTVIGTQSLNLAIIPNNDLKISGDANIQGEDIYANGEDRYSVEVKLTDKYGNLIKPKNTYVNLNNILKTTEKIIFKNIVFIDSKLEFDIVSYFPKKELFNINFSLPKHKKDLELTQDIIFRNNVNLKLELDFKKPIIIDKIEASESDDFSDPLKTIELGKDNNYKITLSNPGRLNPSKITNYKLDLSEYIDLGIGNYLSIFKQFDNILQNTTFIGNANSKNSTKESLLKGIENLVLKNPIINYTIDGNNVSYPLNEKSLSFLTCEKDTLGVRVVGSIQGKGKSEITGQKSNYTDISRSEISTIIVKNANNLIRGMKSGEIVNGIKYVNGDYELEDNPTYETLIVKNGNLLISKDFNKNKKTFGIVVLTDNYNLKSSSSKGNIFVKKDVRYINGFIYSDGAIRSASDVNGKPYEDKELNKSLDLDGSLFSKNTIGGGIDAGGGFLLPGGEKTNDFKLAEKYDLNFIRKVPMNCVDGKDISYNIKITYNPAIQSKAPKVFRNN